MIHKHILDTLNACTLSDDRVSRLVRPAEIWLTGNLSDFEKLWPSSQRLGGAECYAYQYADILQLKCNTIAVDSNLKTLFSAVVDGEGNPILLLPLAIERRYGVRVLVFLDGGLSDYNAPVVFPAARYWRQDDIRLIWRALQTILPTFDIAIFEKMPETVESYPNPLIFLATSNYSASSHAATLSGTWDDFAATRLPHRQRYRRQRQKLEERGKLTFEIAETVEQVDAFLDALIRQKVRRHRETLTLAGFDRLGYRNFVTEATHRLSKPSPIHLSALKIDKIIIATHWGYVAGSRFYYLLPSYEGGVWRSFSPGRLLMEYLLEWCFANGIKTLDFGIGDEEYKNEYCDTRIGLRVATIPVTIKGHVYSAAFTLIEKLKRKIRGTKVVDMLKSILRRR